MLGFWPIYKREIRGFVQSASTYVVLGLLFLIVGTIYHLLLTQFVNDSAMAEAGGPFNTAKDPPNVNVAIIGSIFQVVSAMLMFTIPILAMRSIAAERSSGLFEVLVTCPVGDWSILVGKYFGLLTVGAVIVALCSVYPLTTYFIGEKQGAVPDPRIVASCSVGLLLIFGTYAAFGLMASSMTESQVTAAIVTLIGLLLWNSLAELAMPTEPLQKLANELSAAKHTENFLNGFLSLRDLAFYALASFACLFLAARTLEARRWRV